MTAPTSGVGDLERFRATIAHLLGLNFDESRLALLDEVLRARARARAVTTSEYLDSLGGHLGLREETGVLAEALTVTETFFFRSGEQFKALIAGVLPQRATARGGDRVTMLSAGCASGEEPFSMAMAVREAGIPRADAVDIRGVDINAAMLERARSDNFSPWSLRSTSAERQARWFRPQGDRFVLDAAIREAVQFDQRNLSAADAELWRPGTYDVVFCRNMLMYFEPDAARAAIARIEQSLVPGGFLFLGHAETLRGLSNAFHLCQSHGAFYYQRRAEGERPADVAEWESRGVWSGPSTPTTSWVDTIRDASDRIGVMLHASGDIAPVAPDDPDLPVAQVGERVRTPSAPDLSHAIAMIQQERFVDALGDLDALHAEHANDTDVLLMRAVSLVHAGELAPGEDACRRLLEHDELSPGAHYLLALCQEGRGDLSGARDRDEAAIYLDPTFAMARLHLGLLERRQHNGEAARRELSAALGALAREDSSRLILFGGGFSREALIGLCRSALNAFAAGT